MKTLSLLLAAAALTATPAYANTPKQSFTALNRCIGAKNTSVCRDHITASSVSLYDRFNSYGLTRCLPKNAAYVSESKEGNYTIVRAAMKTGEQKRIARLVFVEEEDSWKLDVPETLRRGMGKNWEKQVNTVEQLYLAMRAQLGGQINCETLQALAAK